MRRRFRALRFRARRRRPPALWADRAEKPARCARRPAACCPASRRTAAVQKLGPGAGPSPRALPPSRAPGDRARGLHAAHHAAGVAGERALTGRQAPAAAEAWPWARQPHALGQLQPVDKPDRNTFRARDRPHEHTKCPTPPPTLHQGRRPTLMLPPAASALAQLPGSPGKKLRQRCRMASAVGSLSVSRSNPQNSRLLPSRSLPSWLRVAVKLMSTSRGPGRALPSGPAGAAAA